MSATATAVKHIVSILAADTTLSTAVGGRIWEGIAPTNTAYPIVLIQSYGDARDILGQGSYRAATALDVSVRVVGPAADVGALTAAADRVCALLHGTGPTTYMGVGRVDGCVRIRETYTAEENPSGTVRYLGGIYRLTIS